MQCLSLYSRLQRSILAFSQRSIIYEFSPRNRIHLFALHQIYHLPILHLQRPQLSLELPIVSTSYQILHELDLQTPPSSDS